LGDVKISVQGEQCFPIVKLMAEHLRAAGFDAYADLDGFNRAQDVLWYVGCFQPIAHTLQSMQVLYPKLKIVLQWSGSDILWTNRLPSTPIDLHVTCCRNWALEVAEKFRVDCKSIELTPIRVHPLSPLPEKPRILVYGHWDAAGGEKYQLPVILAECRRHADECDFHVIGDGWRDMKLSRITYHRWIDSYDAKVEFFKGMSGLIYMPKPHEQHKYGGFVSLTPVEFAQMGRNVIRNGEYPFLTNGFNDLPRSLELMIEIAKQHVDLKLASDYYSHEYAPERCQNALKEVIKQLE
jgi:hypothetical protein